MYIAQDTYQFNLGRAQYRRIRIISGLCLLALVLCAIVAGVAGSKLWGSYAHSFTPYLKWQDALLALAWYIALTALGGCILTVRFLHALRAGYKQGMLTLVGTSAITVRDLSAENLKGIFWIMNSAFWCFVVVLIGLLPTMLVGWTLHLANPILATLATGIAIILSLAGLVLSLSAATFIVIGYIGAIPFGRKLSALHTYKLNGQATVRIDNFVLTVIYPSTPESMVDLNLLAAQDQRQLLALLHRRWEDAERIWNPTLGEEIALALEAAELSLV